MVDIIRGKLFMILIVIANLHAVLLLVEFMVTHIGLLVLQLQHAHGKQACTTDRIRYHTVLYTAIPLKLVLWPF